MMATLPFIELSAREKVPYSPSPSIVSNMNYDNKSSLLEKKQNLQHFTSYTRATYSQIDLLDSFRRNTEIKDEQMIW